MKKELLVEIGTEELPYKTFKKSLSSIKSNWEKILFEHGFMSDFELFYTPRRIVFYHEEFNEFSSDKVIEYFGPAKSIAYSEGKLNKIGMGFLKKHDINENVLEIKDKNGSEFLYYKNIERGSSIELVSEILINKLLNSFHFNKVMRWGEFDFKFIRPVKWFCFVYKDKVLKANFFNIKSAKETRVHRLNDFNNIPFNDVTDYFNLLKRGNIILNQDERRDKILADIDKLEKKNGFNVKVTSDLLDELVMINEFPTALKGSFHDDFLSLPNEVIETSMNEHQKYFATYSNNKEILNHFIFVTNNIDFDSKDIVIGNEKVLNARLSDALFFYQNDINSGLDYTNLKQITFTQDLGTMYDKAIREVNICKMILDLNHSFNIDKELLTKAIMYSKADLSTDMVYEFTNLQGLMGYYYATKLGFDSSIALAMKEHYYPLSEGAKLPSTLFSALVSLSNKIDLLLSIFSSDKLPTGSKDPFGVRRAVNGIISIVLEYKIHLSLTDINKLAVEYNLSSNASSKLIPFFTERVFSYYNDINISIVKSVISTGSDDLLDIDSRVDAINKIIRDDSFIELVSLFKRVSNVIKGHNETIIDLTLFNEYENTLYNTFKKISDKKYNSYLEQLESLFSLKDDLDLFFTNVLVNVDDTILTKNRKSLINSIYVYYKDICDIKEITI